MSNPELSKYLNQFQDYIDGWAKYLVSQWDIEKDFAKKMARVLIAMYLYGITFTITSGRRSRQKQAELLKRWRAGDPSIVVKPAINSKHLTGQALDVVTNNYQLAAQIAQQLGVTAGYFFKNSDPVHYQE